jgi:LysR family glycine cleavage system transcriptional activator
MKHKLPSLDALKVFESAARHLSFSLAAQELCLTKGAVSYQIRKLEQSLDCALFRRSIRQVYLTKAGQRLLQTTQHLFSELAHTLAQIKPEDASHDVIIGATTYVAMRWLSPRISGFSERHPEVSILLQHSVNSDDFRIQDVDFAIRWGQLTAARKRGLLLELPMPLFPVCSPQLLLRNGFPVIKGSLDAAELSALKLASTPLLCEDRSLDLWQLWYGKQARSLDNPRRVIADANVRTQAAVDGQGWTLADALMQRELDSGALVAPFGHQLDGYGYAIQTYPGRFVSQDAQALGKWLVDHV